MYSALCLLPSAGKRTQRTSKAAHVCATITGLLFITDRLSKRQFRVHTGSDLCVYPRRLISQSKERVKYRCAANGTTIHTHTDVCSASTWVCAGILLGRFVVANVTHLIGLDSSLIWASWLTAKTTACWTRSFCCLYRPKPPAN
jgi:hypothetical protein